MTPDAPKSPARIPSKPANPSPLVRTAGGVVVLATLTTGGCQSTSSGEWSTKHQSMSVEKSAELASRQQSARLPVPDISKPSEEVASESVTEPTGDTTAETVEVVAVVEVPVEAAPEPVAEPAPEPAPEPASEPAPEPEPAVEPASEPAASEPQPSVEPSPAPAPEPAAEPAPEPAPEPLPPPEPVPVPAPVGVTDAPPATDVVLREPALPDPMTASMSPRDAAVQLLATAASSPYAALRANAVEGLAKAPDSLRPLIGRALTDNNRGVRFVAANVVAKAGLCDQSNLLEPLVRDESDSVRAGAIAALVECGVKVDQSSLAGMLRSDDPEVRANAYLALGMIGNRSAAPMIRESLGRGMRLVNPLRVKLVELQGGEALVRLGDTAEIEPIRAALFAPGEQGELTVLACQILGRLGDQQSQGALFRIGRPTGEDVRPVEIRLAALRALADLGAPDRAQLFQLATASLKDMSPMVRAQACFTVGAIGGEAAVQSLVPLMADLDPNVQVAAAVAILAADSRR